MSRRIALTDAERAEALEREYTRLARIATAIARSAAPLNDPARASVDAVALARLRRLDADPQRSSDWFTLSVA